MHPVEDFGPGIPDKRTRDVKPEDPSEKAKAEGPRPRGRILYRDHSWKL